MRRSVKQLPESPSPSYRSRVPKLSPTYRSHGVKHEPKLHTRQYPFDRAHNARKREELSWPGSWVVL